MLPVGNPEQHPSIVAASAVDEMNRKQWDMCHVLRMLLLPHTHNFYNQTDSCVCVSLLSLLHTKRSVLLQIKLISQKLLPTNAAAIVLFALTNCFCFCRAEVAMSLNWVWVQKGGSVQGGEGVASLVAVVFSSSDCPLWLSLQLFAALWLRCFL